uniref:Armadillo repeat-containing domain-containing protein n=1 Tax=Gadus morhua TaxID=8049 RepID=A0A8C5CDZ3_GADMO
MVDSGGVSRLGHMKALLGVLAGAGASYGIYKLVTGEVFQRKQKGGGSGRPPGCSVQGQVQETVHSHSIVFLTEVIDSKSPGNLKPENIKMLLWCLQTSSEQTDRCRVLVTLGNAAAFSANQDAVRELGGLTLIARYLSDPAADVRVQTLNALNNLSMNLKNQDVLKVYNKTNVTLNKIFKWVKAK